MRARICSASSCAMFARVAWMKLWGVAKLPIFTLSFAARTCHARLARLTRARGVSSQREGNALFADFWYFWSRKSTIKEKWLYLKKTPHPSAYGCHLLPQSRRRRHTRSAYVSIPTAVGGRHRLLRKRRAKTLIAARQNFSQVLSKVK